MIGEIAGQQPVVVMKLL